MALFHIVFLVFAIPLFSQPKGAHTYFQTEFLFMMRDKQGLVWGQDYEGHAFTSNGYESRNMDDKIPFCSLITAIFEDSEGMIWIGNCELVRHDPRLDKFDLLGSQIVEETSMSPQKFNSFFEDSKGNIWIAAATGLYRFSKSDRTFRHFSKLTDVTIAFEAPDGKIWFDAIAGDNKTSNLHSLNPATGKVNQSVKLSEIPLGNSLPVWQFENKVIQLGDKTTPDFLILTSTRCFRFNSKTLSIAEIQPPQDRPNAPFYSIISHAGMVLAGVPANRVLRFLPNENKFVPYWAPPITGVNFYRLFNIDEDTWWALSLQYGYINHDAKSPFSIERFPEFMWNEGEGFFERQLLFRGNIYLHVLDSLKSMHPANKDLPAIKLEMPVSDFPNFRFTYREDPEKNWLWMLMRAVSPDEGKMLCAFDQQGKLMKKYPFPLLEGAFTQMVFDKDRNLWIGTTRHGVLKFDMKLEVLLTNPLQEMDAGKYKMPDLVEVVMVDRENHLWVCPASAGARRYDLETGKIEIFRHNLKDTNSLSGDWVTALFEDSKGRIWFGTHFGVTRWEPSGNRFRRYSTGAGLLQTSVRTIVEDKNGDIWVATVQHLNKFLPGEERFLPFGRNDGQDCSFFKQYAFCDEKGNLFFEEAGGGAWIGHPDEIKNYHSDIPPLFLSSFLVSNQPVHPGGEDGILRQAINFTDKIELDYHHNSFTFQYTALEFIQKPNYVEYAYQLEGFDDDWQYVGKKREAAYTGLSPGHYVFKVKCRNHQGFWGEPRQAVLVVHPPWWRTWWAYCLWAALLFGSLYVLYRFQLHRKLEQAEARRLKELDAVKTRLYTNVTHEFRTPLTVILGMAEQLKSQVSENVKTGLDMIKRNGRELLDLVNQMLDLAKLESGSLPIHIVQGDVVLFLKYLLESFHSLADAKNIALHFSSSVDSFVMNYDAEKLRRIVSNLLSNAIKFTPAGGTVTLDLGMRDEGRGMKDQTFIPHSSFLIQVKDTGKGISPENLPHVFDRFYQADDSATRQGEGTGIGLALTKELVKLLGGNIEVSSEVGKGTAFRVRLPVTHSPRPPKWEQQMPLPAEVFEKSVSEISSFGSPFRGSGGVPSLLIIEDNPDVVRYLASCLEADYQIETAKDGSEGIEMAIELVPDLIISDVMMPEKDGFEVCKTLKNHEVTSHIPIVLLTAKADVESRITGLRRGADAYLAKPFNKEELMVTLANLLELRRKLQAKYASISDLRFRISEGGSSEIPNPNSEIEDAFLQKLKYLIEQDLTASDLDVPRLARQVAMSRTQLFRKIKALTGASPSLFIRNVRLQKARELLQTTSMNVSEVAYETGFADLGHFSRSFKEVFGVPPSNFREK